MSQQEFVLEFSQSLVPGSIKKAMSNVEAKSRDLWQVPIDAIEVIENFNVRVRNESFFAHIRNLANLMKVEGYKQDKPLAGYVAKKDGVDTIYIYDGHCRLEAARLARSEGVELEVLPVVISGFGHSMEDLTMDLVTDNNGRPLSVFETAVVCKRMYGFNWAPAEIASRSGFTVNYVNDLLYLMSAPREIRDMVQSDQIAATKAIEVLRKHGEKAVEILTRSLKVAQSAGKSKITGKYVPGANYQKALKKQAPEMAVTLSTIKSDPGFAGLSQETQLKLQSLLDSLISAQDKDLVNHGQEKEDAPIAPEGEQPAA